MYIDLMTKLPLIPPNNFGAFFPLKVSEMIRFYKLCKTYVLPANVLLKLTFCPES